MSLFMDLFVWTLAMESTFEAPHRDATRMSKRCILSWAESSFWPIYMKVNKTGLKYSVDIFSEQTQWRIDAQTDSMNQWTDSSVDGYSVEIGSERIQ